MGQIYGRCRPTLCMYWFRRRGVDVFLGTRKVGLRLLCILATLRPSHLYPCNLATMTYGMTDIKIKATVTKDKSLHAIPVRVTSTHLHVGTVGDSDAIVSGDFERKVEPQGENFSWYLIPDEDPPMLEMCLDKDAAEVYQTFSYGSLLWPRLFSDDIPLGEGLFEADLTDLPPELLEKWKRDQARSDAKSREERDRRKMMTEEEVEEETARNWNDEFAKHGMPHRLDTMEDRTLQKYRN
ncbi:unnamed protein product [Polarella glacialis]|uniref:Uncharacterized protein n=1 Tax=Polarella glacialis TaxID=89957 RepID=A0A813LH31_POLGL|nr:unnamed protein product [Polarella glacialis]